MAVQVAIKVQAVGVFVASIKVRISARFMDVLVFVVRGVFVAAVAALADCEMNSNDHDAPLLRLVARLHEGTSLADRVRRCRWKRKRPAADAASETVADETVEPMNEKDKL